MVVYLTEVFVKSHRMMKITVPVVYLFLIQHFFTALYPRFDTLQLIYVRKSY